MATLVKKTNQKNNVSFMPHTFNHNKHPFGQWGYFKQEEPFEKL
jgi:hypothetical protein